MGKIKTLQKLKHQKSQHFKEEKIQLTCKMRYFEGQGRHRMKVGQEKKKHRLQTFNIEQETKRNISSGNNDNK